MDTATSAVMFGKVSDNWETPQAFFDQLHAEFDFRLDVAATEANKKCAMYLGPDNPFAHLRDALVCEWGSALRGAACFMNPPYSRCAEFIAKAAAERLNGVLTVALVPSRTDTRYFHAHIWDQAQHRCRPGVELRFVKGRLKFGTGTNSAPFPSMVVIFRPDADRADGITFKKV